MELLNYLCRMSIYDTIYIYMLYGIMIYDTYYILKVRFSSCMKLNEKYFSIFNQLMIENV